MINLSKEAFDEWKEHPVTKEVFSELKKVKQDLLEQMATGATLTDFAETTHGKTHHMIGHIEGLDQLLGIEFTDESETDSE